MAVFEKPVEGARQGCVTVLGVDGDRVCCRCACGDEVVVTERSWTSGDVWWRYGVCPHERRGVYDFVAFEGERGQTGVRARCSECGQEQVFNLLDWLFGGVAYRFRRCTHAEPGRQGCLTLTGRETGHCMSGEAVCDCGRLEYVSVQKWVDGMYHTLYDCPHRKGVYEALGSVVEGGLADLVRVRCVECGAEREMTRWEWLYGGVERNFGTCSHPEREARA